MQAGALLVVQLKEDNMTDKRKELLDKLILELDKHAPIEDYRKEDYEYLFDIYVKPLIDEYNHVSFS